VEALAVYREALSLWGELGDAEWTAQTQFRIGWMLWLAASLTRHWP